jgi:hypothetical protein
MYSIRLDMGQGQPCRVALRKDLALAFVGLDKATQVVEESRKEDDDGWAVVNGAPGSRPLIRPNWPDEEAPWKIGSGNRRARQMREDKERVTLLKRYLEASSDDDEEDDGAGRFPSHRGRASHTPHRPPGTGSATSDAKAALLSAMNRSSHRVATRRSAPPVFVPGGVVACVCKNNGSGGSLIPCSSCRTWFHLACVGNEAVQLGENWVCDPCIVQARRATLSSPTGRTPIAQRFTHERSHSGFRGDHALALAPSPMFAQDSGIPVTPMSMGPRTPPGRRRSARVLSYGADFWGPESPTTPAPAPRFFSNSTPRLEDPAFDVNSTPSRHLNTDPRMAGEFHSLFAVTPLMGRSRNASGMPGETPLPFPGNPMYAHSSGRRLVSGSSETGVVGRHEFLQSLTADRRASGERRPLVEPPSPSPYGGIGLGGPRHGSSNSMSHLRDDSAAASQRGLGLGMPMVHPRDE